VQLFSLSTDLVDEDAAKALFDKVKQQFGHADVPVNNAGGMTSYTGPDIAKVNTETWWKDFVRLRGMPRDATY